MAMKLSEMKTMIRQNLGNRDDLDTYRTDWLNMALGDTAAVFNWRSMKEYDKESLRSAQGIMEYPLPERTKDILRVLYRDGTISRTLIYVPVEQFDTIFSSPEDDGFTEPVHYTRRLDQLELYPIPEITGNPIELYLVRWPADFDDDVDDENPLERLDHALIAQATAYGFGSQREWDQRRIWHSEWFKIVKRALRSEHEPDDWFPRYASIRTSLISPFRTTGNQGRLYVGPV